MIGKVLKSNFEKVNDRKSILIYKYFLVSYPAQSCRESRIVLKSEVEIKSTVSLLNDSFAKLLRQLKEELKDTSVSLIIDHLHDCGYTYLPLEELEACKDFKDLIRKLDKHYGFLDCEVLTTIAKLAKSTLSQEFQEHSEAALRFRESHTVQELRECLQEIFNPHIKNKLANAPKVHIDLHNAWTERVINELFILIRCFFPTCDHLALTKVISITCSSVHITYFMTESPDEIEEIISYSKKKVAFMKYIGVCGITVNNEIILQDTNDETFHFDVALLDSSFDGQVEAVKFLLEIRCDSEVQIALVLASYNGYCKVVELIINNYPNILCNNAFLTANSKEFSEVTNRFLRKQTNRDIHIINRWTSLMAASLNGHHQVVKLLLQKMADPNIQNNDGQTALMVASQNGHQQVVELLFKKKVDPNLKDNTGKTALMVASQNDHQQVVELLLKKNVDPNIQNNDGWTALLVASQNGYQKVVELLLKEKVDPNLKDINGKTALMAASQNGHHKAVELLLKNKADPNLKDNNGETALMAASQNGHQQVVESLLKKKADPNIQNNDGRTALMVASQNGHQQVVELLLKKKVDPNLKGNTGKTALMVASQNGHQQVVELLLKKNADPNIQNNDGWTALLVASQNGYQKVVELLLKEKVDPNLKDINGKTALMAASQNGHQQAVELLLKNKADPNLQDNNGETALILVSQNGHQQVVKMLLKKKADPDIQNNDGWTALMVASQNDHQQVVQLLLKKRPILRLIIRNWKALIQIIIMLIIIIIIGTIIIGQGNDDMTASQNGHQQVDELLFKEKVDPSIQYSDGWIALM